MTSPVDTSVKLYSSQMANAPVLNGTAGSLIALLDACLKDGFDTKTITSLVALAGVMTATFSGSHSSQVDSVLLVAGVTGGPAGFAGANGEQKVVARPLSTTATWATALPDGTYTGTITIKMAPLGWVKSFSGTNAAAYKSSEPAATGHLLRVDDTATTLARVVGYESMSDINTGLGAFPTALAMPGGGYWPKSTAANTNAVGWVLAGDSRGFLVHFLPGLGASASSFGGTTRGFGDARPLKPGGDAYACFLNYSILTSVPSMTEGALDYGSATRSSFPRGHTGLGGAIDHGSYPYTGSTAILSGTDPSLGPFPSVVDGSLRLSVRYFATANSNAPARAELPGLYSVPQSALLDTFRMGDRTPGTGLLSGRNFYAVNGTTASMSSTPTATNSGATFIDVTGPWER